MSLKTSDVTALFYIVFASVFLVNPYFSGGIAYSTVSLTEKE